MKSFKKKFLNKTDIYRVSLTSVGLLFVLGFFYNSQAMHIAEGFLPPMWAGIWYLVSLPFVFYGFKSLNNVMRDNPKAKILLAMAGAFTFILSALKIPSLTGSCSHPTGIALGAILFGPGPMAIVGVIVLLFQALLLAHGGITTLGANVFSMAIVGAWVAYIVYKLLRKTGCSTSIAVFIAAFLGDLLTYVVTAFQLAIAFPSATGGIAESLVKFLGVFAVTQVPIAVAEGILSVLVFRIIATYSKKDVVGLESYLGYGEENKLQEGYASFSRNKLFSKTVILLALTVLVAIIPLYVVKNAEFGGADGEAMDIVTEINPDFSPILDPIIEPASGEIESMLFALQAAIGAGIIGFGIGKISKKKDV